jgi:clan AA aspartic protease (TIGR02281 family)
LQAKIDKPMTDSDLEIILPDDGTILVCPKCYTNNPEGSNFCLNCGFSLRKPSVERKKWMWLLVSVVLFIAAMFYFHISISKLRPPKASRQPVPKVAQTPTKEKTKTEAPPVEPIPPKKEGISPVSSPLKIPLGLVAIKDITGKVINEIPVPVVGGGWVALPKQVCIGGAEWILKMEPDTEMRIVGGIYNDYDSVGLWRILEDLTVDGPELYPWSSTEQLAWLSLASDESPELVVLENSREQGNFIEGLLPEDFRAIGVLVQQDRAVGWTFGDLASGAFVWSGDEGQYLRPQIRVDDFYRFTFANSREEEFTKAQGMGADYNSIERLEAFANGFKFETKLSAKDTPTHLRKATIIESIRALIADSLKNGAAKAVADIFDVQMLIEAADIGLLMDIGRAATQGYDFENAINLTENVIAGLPSVSEQNEVKLVKFFSGLYQNWIDVLFKNGNLQGAWRAYRLGTQELPDDADLHLMGVELALAENDWAGAEEILVNREYPSSLNDKVRNLQTQISELKAQEGKIVINFSPGTRQIPLTAVLNGSSYQKFIVDTGASLITIPRSTAEDLELEVDTSNPVRKIYTAGGIKYAPEVTLTSVTVEGWEVTDLKALVLDLPNQPEWGLLGMNYLRRFRMDINTESGILLLEPR